MQKARNYWYNGNLIEARKMLQGSLEVEELDMSRKLLQEVLQRMAKKEG